MTSFIADPAQLKDHAAEVRQIAKGVEQASEAASEEGFGGVDAYGPLGSVILALPLNAFFGDTGGLIRNTADFGGAMADGLESNSDVYASVDDDIRDSLNQLKSDWIS